jgi:hypothetical protein
MLTGSPSLVGKEQRTAKALGAIAVGMVKLIGRLHQQAVLAARCPIGCTSKGRMAVLIEGNGTNAPVPGGALVDVPGIKSGVSRDVGGKLGKSEHGALIQGAEIGDIGLVARVG